MKLGDIISVKFGNNLNVRELHSEASYPIYGGNGINGYYDNYNVDKGTLIIGRVGFNCGCIHKTESEAWVTDNALIVSLYSQSISIPWLQLLLIWCDIRKTSNSTAQPVVSRKSILPLIIPIPSKKEQERIAQTYNSFIRIVEIIENNKDKLEAIINQTKTKILELAMQGRLVPQDPSDEPAADMLKRVNPKAKIITDNPHYPKLPDNWVLTTIQDAFIINPKNKLSDNTSVGFVPMNAIRDGFSDEFTYEECTWKDIKSGFTHFADGDIAVAKISPCLENRKSMILRNLPNGVGAGTTELLIFRSDIVISEYGLLFFKSDYFIRSCTGTFNGVVGQQRVGKNVVEEIAIPIPPQSTQKKIIECIHKWFSQLDKIQISLQN